MTRGGRSARSPRPTADPAAELTPAWHGLLPKLLPELTLAFLAVAVAVAPERVAPGAQGNLYSVAVIEVFFCMAQATLTDVATRLRQRPPWWGILLIGGGLALMYPDVPKMIAAAFGQGWAVFLPFLWSTLERLRELWTMPRASDLEKMRRRALVSGRVSLVLVFGFGAVAVAGVTYLLDDVDGGFAVVARNAAGWLAAAYGLAAFDAARVHLPAFARRPRALFGRLGLDPLGVDYLAPL